MRFESTIRKRVKEKRIIDKNDKEKKGKRGKIWKFCMTKRQIRQF